MCRKSSAFRYLITKKRYVNVDASKAETKFLALKCITMSSMVSLNYTLCVSMCDGLWGEISHKCLVYTGKLPDLNVACLIKFF